MKTKEEIRKVLAGWAGDPAAGFDEGYMSALEWVLDDED